jgi:trehalose 6-phosphate phosphatase
VDRLDNPVRRYRWGSAWDIPALLGVPPDGSPVAELWTGAHSAVGCGSPIAAMFAGGCRAEWDCQARECGDDAVGHTGGVSPFAVEALTEGVRAVTRDPVRAAMFCDIGGTLGPVVDRADDAQAPGAVSRLLGALGRRYACDTLGPRLTAALGLWRGPVCRFAAARDTRELRVLRIRIGDKGPIAAFHWRGVPDEDAALGYLPGRRGGGGGGGAPVQWGRKVLDVRPPVPIEKGQSVRDLVGASLPHVAFFGGSDVTDLDAFDVLDALVAAGRLDSSVRVGVRSAEGPGDMVIRADLLADGVEGFAGVLEGLLRAVR